MTHLVQAEAYVDDPASAQVITLEDDGLPSVARVLGGLGLGDLAPGHHRVGVRLIDDQRELSEPLVLGFYLPETPGLTLGQGGANRITGAEGWIGDDPGAGAGTALAAPEDGQYDNGSEQARGMISLAEVADGVHPVQVRVRDANGNWSLPLTQSLALLPGGSSGGALAGSPRGIGAAEVFFGNDPGAGNGQPLAVQDQGGLVQVLDMASLAGLASGHYPAQLRLRNQTGLWSAPLTQSLFVPPGLVASTGLGAGVALLTGAEYRVNADPFTAAPAADGAFGGLAELVDVEVDPPAGDGYTREVRFYDQAGRTSATGFDADPSPNDADWDGLPDTWEQHWLGGLGQSGRDDPDGDGLTNREELRLGTNPLVPDGGAGRDGSAGLLAWYPFTGGDAGDRSGKGHDATLNNALPAADRAGSADNAMAFDGVDALASVPDAPGLRSPAFSILTWLRPDPSALSGDADLVAKASDAAQAGWALGLVDGVPRVSLWDDAGVQHVLSASAALPAETWHQIAARFDGQTLDLYLDGQLAASTAVAADLAPSTAPLTMGRDADGLWPFAGSLDEVMLFERALSDTELATLYADGGFLRLALDAPTDLTLVRAGERIDLRWSSNAPADRAVLIDLRRDAVPGYLAAPEPGDPDWVRFTADTPNDGEEALVIPGGLSNASDWRVHIRFVDSDVQALSPTPFRYVDAPDLLVTQWLANPDRGLVFDGLDDRAEAANRDGLYDLTTWTIAVRAEPLTDTPLALEQAEPLLWKDATGDGTAIAYALVWLGERFAVLATDLETGANHVLTSSALNAGEPHRVAATYDGETLRLFIDGIEDTALAIGPITSPTGSAPLRFGAGNGRAYRGTLREVRLWDYARTPAELTVDTTRRLYGSEGGLVGWWPLQESAGDEALDASDNDNPALLGDALAGLAPSRSLDAMPADFVLEPGSDIELLWQVGNLGQRAVTTAFKDRITLFPDGQPEAARTLATQDIRDVLPLEPGAGYARSLLATLPSDLDAGAWTLQLHTDAEYRISEFSDDNNLAAAGLLIEVPPPVDLAVTDIQAPASAEPGAPITLSWTVHNGADGIARAPWRETLVLSGDAVLGDDLVLADLGIDTALAPGRSVTRTRTINLPAVTGLSGPVRLGVRVDTDDTLADLNPADNAALAAADTVMGDALWLDLGAARVTEGAGALLASVSRSGDTTEALTVTLSSDDPDEAQVPTSVSIPAGSAAASFDLAGVEDGFPDGAQDLAIRANAAGHTEAVATVRVDDSGELIGDYPDLVIEQIDAPADADTETRIEVGYVMANRGTAEAVGDNANPEFGFPGSWQQRVYLSSDAQPGGDTLLGTFEHIGTLGVDETAAQVLPVDLPQRPGDYWIIVVADATGRVFERGEANNRTVSASPIQVRAAYSASVETAIEVSNGGEPIPLTGTARASADDGPAAGVDVAVSIWVKGTRRVLHATTDAEGRFAIDFQPLPGEAGLYEIGAAHPGAPDTPVQDSFTIQGLGLSPADQSLRLAEGADPGSVALTLTNKGPLPITGLALSVLEQPENLTLDIDPLADTLAGDASATLGLRIGVIDASSTRGTIRLRIDNDQGISVSATITVRITPLQPSLSIDPGALSGAMLVGDQRTLSLTIRNSGGRDTGPITLDLPAMQWLASATATPLPSLAPGESTELALLLSPPADLPLGVYSGTLTLRMGDGGGRGVPFELRAVASGVGDLRIAVVDEYFYFDAAAPGLPSARVRLLDWVDGSLVAEALTDADGLATFPGLGRDYYRVAVTAADHGSATHSVYVEPDSLTEHRVFISREAVRYEWSVREVELEDRYEVRIEAQFETRVPIPVVVFDPPQIDLAPLTAPGQSMQIDMTVTNHGLIAANHVRLEPPAFPGYRITPLIGTIDVLPAETSMTIPILVERFEESVPVAAFAAATMAPAAPAGAIDEGLNLALCAAWSIPALFDYVCGYEEVDKELGIPVRTPREACPWPVGGTKTTVTSVDDGDGGGGGGGSNDDDDDGGNQCVGCGIELNERVPTVSREACVDCIKDLTKILYDWIVPDFPWDVFGKLGECGSAAWSCATAHREQQRAVLEAAGCLIDQPDWACASEAIDPERFLLDDADCLNGMMGCADEGLPGVSNVIKLLQLKKSLNDSCEAYNDEMAQSATGNPQTDELAARFDQMADTFEPLSLILDEPNPLMGPGALVPGAVAASSVAPGAPTLNATATSTPAWFSETAVVGLKDFFAAVAAATTLDGERGPRINSAERDTILLAALPDGVDTAALDKLVARWNRTLDYREQGIFDLADLPPDADPDFIARDALFTATQRARDSQQAAQEAGYDGPMAALMDQARTVAQLDIGGDGVCSVVKLQLDQQLVFTRQGFQARLDLSNGTAAALSEVYIALSITDADGNPAGERFGITAPLIANLGNIDGSGTLAADTDGSVEWTLAPNDSAAPLGETVYYVGGTLRYRDGTSLADIDLVPMPIRVQPNAAIRLDYFHQRDVYADDPFTDPIEPSIPYALGVQVRNTGYGTARNLRIDSGAPRIVDNEKGLAIDFELIGTQLGASARTPSMGLDFGDLAPGAVAVGQWLFQSSLQGHFIDYRATLTHVDPLGILSSLVEQVQIHEMIRPVRAGGDADDGIPDFLVNDEPDTADLPDTLYLSDGGIEPVTALLDAATADGTPSTARPEITLTTPAATGHRYLRFADPGDGRFPLLRVLRSDGLEIPLNANAWQTDRTFPGVGQAPLREALIHLFDTDSTGNYTLTYDTTGACTPADTDCDGLADAWEYHWFGDLARTGDGDADDDGRSDLEEYEAGTDPTLATNQVRLRLREGLNLIALPTLPLPADPSCLTWLAEFEAAAAAELQQLDADGAPATCAADGAFDLETDRGYALTLDELPDRHMDLLLEPAADCGDAALTPGLNLIGHPRPEPGLTCRGWLGANDPALVPSIGRLDAGTGRIQTCAWQRGADDVDRPAGADFLILPGAGYRVFGNDAGVLVRPGCQ